LGIDPHHYFSGREKIVKRISDVILFPAPTHYLINCSIVKEQVFGEQFAPIIRILQKPKYVDKELEYTFDQVQYIPLATSEVSELKIYNRRIFKTCDTW